MVFLPRSLGFFVKCVLAAELAILHEFQSVRVIFLVFLCVVISLFAFGAGKSNFDSCIISHLAAPPISKLFDSAQPLGVTESVYLPLKSGIGQSLLGWRTARFFLFPTYKNRHKEKALSQR